MLLLKDCIQPTQKGIINYHHIVTRYHYTCLEFIKQYINENSKLYYSSLNNFSNSKNQTMADSYKQFKEFSQ